jgi:glycosyltransferase involved in cell wall biosynthesis
MFVGDGESRAEMEAWVAKEGVRGVHFAGFRNQSELPEVLTAADVFVLPSKLETWGLVVNEAMCFALPVVVTDKVGAGGDLVRHGVNGFVYPVGDVDALAAHLRQLLADAGLRQRMGIESRGIIRKWSYAEDVDVIAESLERAIPFK